MNIMLKFPLYIGYELRQNELQFYAKLRIIFRIHQYFSSFSFFPTYNSYDEDDKGIKGLKSLRRYIVKSHILFNVAQILSKFVIYYAFTMLISTKIKTSFDIYAKLMYNDDHFLNDRLRIHTRINTERKHRCRTKGT